MNHKKHLQLFVFLLYAAILFASESPSIGSLQIFPADNPWNWDISAYAVHPNSDNFVATIGGTKTLHPDFGTVWQGAPNGIPYLVVDGTGPLVEINYTAYGDESDAGPFPIPLDAPIEGGAQADGDRHVIVVDTTNAMLYELYRAYPRNDRWDAESGAKYDLKSNALRPEGWTSADAAGLPIFPGLVRYEEVYVKKAISHALRFTVSRSQRKYLWPARHFANSSTDPNRPPMGLRLRLKAGFVISGYSEPVQVILRALKKYGMIVADNGSDWYISGSPDERWNDDVLGELKNLAGSNFEVVQTVDANGEPIFPDEVTGIDSRKSTPSLSITTSPNPSSRTFNFHFDLPRSTAVKLTIYNITGQQVEVVIDTHLTAGIHQKTWQAVHLAGGVYFYLLQAGDVRATGKLFLLGY